MSPGALPPGPRWHYESLNGSGSGVTNRHFGGGNTLLQYGTQLLVTFGHRMGQCPNGSGSRPGSQVRPGTPQPLALTARRAALAFLPISRSRYRYPSR